MQIGAPLNSEAEPTLQWIEVASSLQIPSFHIIGLPCPEVEEARERIRAAVEASGFEFPRRRVVINLSPASIRKRGTGLDLAMALAVLAAQDERGLLTKRFPLVAWGELGLDGAIKPARQTARALYAAWAAGASTLLVSVEDYPNTVRWIENIRMSGDLKGEPPCVLSAPTLSEAWRRLREEDPQGPKPLDSPTASQSRRIGPTTVSREAGPPTLLPLPPSLERVLGVAATGSHHLLLLGPRGTGKSHALEWLISLLPAASPRIRLQAALLSELGESGSLTTRDPEPSLPPIRRVGAQVRPAALLGRADPLQLRPGEFTHAHGGLLIADELPEWPRDSREALREPLERGRVTLTRANGSLELPADFRLAANGNLCPCGGWPPELPVPVRNAWSGKRPPRCKCKFSERARYLQRLSGPVLDRMDLVLLVSSQRRDRLSPRAARSNQERVHDQVLCARALAIKRWGVPPGLLSASELQALVEETPSWGAWLDELQPASLRARHKITRVALSFACWDGLESPTKACFIEASCYRPERQGLLE